MKRRFWHCCMLLCACLFPAGMWGQDLVVPGTPETEEVKEKPEHDHTVNFGAKGGFTSSLFLVPHLNVNGVSIQEIQNNYRIGYFGSLFMRINFGKHFLQPEVSYTVNSCDISFDKPLPEGSNANDIPEKASIASTIHSVDVPVIYGYNIIKEGPYSLAIFGGPKIRFMLQKQSDITFENFDQTDIHETLRPLNLCATLGVAVTISRIFFDFRYDVGLHNMSKQIEYTVPPVEGMPGTVEPDKGIYFHRKNNVMSFSLGVFF